MSYRAKSGARQERKLGLEAVEALKADPSWDEAKILAFAKLNEQAFIKLDEMKDADFCKAMDDMRADPAQYSDVYRIFWWWRFSHEKAAKGSEEDGAAKPESRYACFMVTQFLAKPFSDEWEADRLTLKPGATPLITENQIAEGLDHKMIKRWLYVWHDRDIYTSEDEITDAQGLRKAGDRKFKHVHIMLDIPAKVSVSTVARWFSVPPEQVEVIRGRGGFLDGCEYLPHESPKAVEVGKTHYDYDELHGSPGFDFVKELSDLKIHRMKYGRRAGDMTPADTMRMHVLKDGWTLRDCREDDPLTYAAIRSSLPPLRLDYLLDAPPPSLRLTIYVDGPGGIGKSSFCEYLAQSMFPGVKHPYFCIGNDDRVTFDGYDGEPAIIWDDMRVTDFIKKFGSNGTYKVLDPHPRKDAQQAKNSRIILSNTLNIINGVQPYGEFISGLAGTYTDRDGIHHEAEDENQAWRRFPMILCIRETDFDILINQGFVNKDSSSFQTMIQYANVRGSMARIMQVLDGTAKKTVLQRFAQPAVDAVLMLTAANEGKISNPDDIPEEFVDYGRVTTKEELEEKFLDQLEATLEENLTMLLDFARWVWDAPTCYEGNANVCHDRHLVPTFSDYCFFHPDWEKYPGQSEYEWANGLTKDDIDLAVNHYCRYDDERVKRLRSFDDATIRTAIIWFWSNWIIRCVETG